MHVVNAFVSLETH